MDYDTEEKLSTIISDVNNDLLESLAILQALIEINESCTTECVVLDLTRDLTRKVFHKMCNCKSILKLN